MDISDNNDDLTNQQQQQHQEQQQQQQEPQQPQIEQQTQSEQQQQQPEQEQQQHQQQQNQQQSHDQPKNDQSQLNDEQLQNHEDKQQHNDTDNEPAKSDSNPMEDLDATKQWGQNATRQDNPLEQPNQTGIYEFVRQLDDYRPVIPDVIVTHYLNSAGFRTGDTRVVRLIALAAQKFISDVVGDSLQYCKLRATTQNKKATKDKQYSLKLEDLTAALEDHGLQVKKPHYFI